MAPFRSLILLLAALAIASAYITDIVVDVPNGQIYVTDEDTLYEIDNVDLEQNAVHKTNGSSGSLFIGKRSNNKQVLYDFLVTEDSSNIVFFRLPLRNQELLVPTKSSPTEKYQSLRATYDGKDRVGIFNIGRNLTLVDLNNLNIMDTVYYWTGNRKFGRNVVYNRQNQHVIAFYTRVPIRGNYGISVDEFTVENGIFEEVNTTYDCLCGDGYNLTASPFYKVLLEACAIQYKSDSARIWCADAEHSQFFDFNAENLTDFRVINHGATGPSFHSVAWDFKGKFAYGIYGHTDAVDTTGFSVWKIRLSDGQIVAAYFNTIVNIDPNTFELDPNEPHLYISLDSETPKIISLNTNDMATLTEIALTV